MNSNITGNTYRTEDYSIFRFLEGNRSIDACRVSKILKSINIHGYIYNPIVVNEQYEIIDGQGRFEALKSLNWPIDYVISPGSGLAQCIALNAYSSVWTMRDYIDSYCKQEKDDYIRLRELLDKYPDYKAMYVICLATGLSQQPTETIKSGRLKIPPAQAFCADNDLSFIKPLYPLLARLPNGPKYYPYAITFARHCGVDDERLLQVVSRAELDPGSTVRKALDCISDIYNWKLRDASKKIYLYSLYEKSQSKKFSWYSSNWCNPSYNASIEKLPEV